MSCGHFWTLFLCVNLSFLATFSETKYFHSFAGPFKINIRRLERCPVVTENSLNFTMKDERTKITQKDLVFSLRFSMPFDLNNSLSAHIQAASWNPVAGWRTNAFIAKMPRFCDVVEKYMKFITDRLRISAFGEMLTCPYYPGLYRADNITIIWNDLPVKHLVYGRWRADLQIVHRNGDLAACLRMFVDTVPT